MGEPEERLTHCGLVTLALVNCQGSSQKQVDRKDKDNGIGWRGGGSTWTCLGSTEGMSSLDNELELHLDTPVTGNDDIDEQILNFESKEVCSGADGGHVG